MKELIPMDDYGVFADTSDTARANSPAEAGPHEKTRGLSDGRCTSFGFCPDGYNQIVIFTDGNEFREVLAENPNMVAIAGNDPFTIENFPGVYVSGVMENSQPDRPGPRP